MATTNNLDKKGGNKGGTTKPPMTEKTASFYETQAAAAATAQALTEGAPPEAVAAFMEMDKYEVPGTSLVLGRLTLQVVWALEQVNSAYVGEEGKMRAVNSFDIAMGALCYAEPLQTWRLAKAGKKEELEERAFEIAGMLDARAMGLVNDWMNAQNQRAKENAGEDDEPEVKQPGGPEGNGQPGSSAPG